MKNWSNTYEYRAPRIVAPTTVDEVRRVVAEADRVRPLGSKHSFNGIADTTGTLVDMTALPVEVTIDEAAGTATVSGGTRYGVIAAALDAAGFALHNMGSLPHISVAGAVATGTHGSGVGLGNLSSAIRGLELVTADGDLRRVTADDPELAGSVVALGALGPAVRVTVAVEPRYLIRQDTYRGLPWDTMLGSFREVAGGAYSISVFTNWVEDEVEQLWVKRRVDSEDAQVDDRYFGAARDLEERPELVPGVTDNLTRRGVAVPWHFGLPHFRLDVPPSAGDEIQTEYFVAIDDAGAALSAVRALGDRIAPHLTVTELRTMAADGLWLSPASGRDSLAIHFTWRNHPDEVFALLPAIEEALAPFAPRPHWGKLNRVDPAGFATAYPRLGDQRELVLRHDPAGKFRNEYLDRVLGLGASEELPETSAPMGR
ncbi:FAD-binding protein [Amnibacterium sp.]|uniref:FAD-binding protein n=1 Tax=Amnibacterium sp. TaxID=1872496 RepID=UPI0026147E5C|nr:FAD-binding protein [Amnibacterium sp.]MCU1473343.1 FAD-binding protein [Amnibacterium sp.]